MEIVKVGGKCAIVGCNLRHIYGSTLCFKHARILNEEGHKAKSVEEVPWWEEGGIATEGGEKGVVRCDDDPSLHYGLCEFDTRDGICWHCKNMVHPDIHLIHLICNRRFGRRLLQPYGILGPSGEDLDPELLEALDRILEPLELRDVTSHSSLPPHERVKALQEMDDREHILSELGAQFPDWRERGLDQFDFDPNGVGLGYSISRLYDDIHAFNQEEWGPEWAIEWGLGGDPVGLESSSVAEGDTEMHPVGYILGAGYLWFVLQMVIDSEGELIGLLANDIGIAIAFAPLWLINKIFQRRISDVEEESEEPTTNIREAGTNSSLARKQLIATTIVMAIGFLLPWRLGGWEWGQTFNGLEELRWAPSELSFWLFDARDLFYGISTTEWLSIVIRSALPLVFLLTFASTWYMHLRGKDSFSRTASRIHLYVFGLWYTLVFLGWGMTFPSEYDIGLYITAIAGIGLDTTPDGIMSKYIRRDG
mgnify:CR=1 FL=1